MSYRFSKGDGWSAEDGEVEVILRPAALVSEILGTDSRRYRGSCRSVEASSMSTPQVLSVDWCHREVQHRPLELGTHDCVAVSNQSRRYRKVQPTLQHPTRSLNAAPCSSQVSTPLHTPLSPLDSPEPILTAIVTVKCTLNVHEWFMKERKGDMSGAHLEQTPSSCLLRHG